MRVSEREGGDPRCPYCHDALGGALPTSACDGCQLLAHVECWAALEECPTLGCGREAPSGPPAAPAPSEPFTVGGTTTVTPAAGPPPVVQVSRRGRRRRPPRPRRPVAVEPSRPPTPRHPDVVQPSQASTRADLLDGGSLWLGLLIALGGLTVWVAVSTLSAWTTYRVIDPFWARLCLALGGPSSLLLAISTLVVLLVGLRRRRPSG